MEYTLDMLNRDRIKLAQKYAMQFAKYAVGDKVVSIQGDNWLITGLVTAEPYSRAPYVYYSVLRLNKNGKPYKNNQSSSLTDSNIVRKL